MINKIGIIGAGVMGIGLTVDLSTSGYEIVLIDNSATNLEKAKVEVEKDVRFAGLYKKNIEEEPEIIMKKINFSLEIGDVADCDFIIENVTENFDIKKNVYLQLNNICKKDTYFAVNSSCISIDRIASLIEKRENVIGMHFMNPVILKKTIEVIKGYYTSDETIAVAKQLLDSLGKKGVIINDAPGFASNRVSHLFMNEAAYVVMDRVCDPEQVDQLFRECFGHTMGPLQTADLIGLDTVMNSLDVLYESYQDSKYRCCPLLRQMVDQGRLGRKSGEGFYKYTR